MCPIDVYWDAAAVRTLSHLCGYKCVFGATQYKLLPVNATQNGRIPLYNTQVHAVKHTEQNKTKLEFQGKCPTTIITAICTHCNRLQETHLPIIITHQCKVELKRQNFLPLFWNE